MKFVDLLYLVLYYFLKFLSLLPNSALKIVARDIANLAYALNFKHKKIIKANLRFCFPEKSEVQISQLARQIYKNFAKFGFEFLKRQKTTPSEIKELVSIDDMGVFQEAIASKRPLVFITAHFSCWELIPFIYASNFGGISIVTRTLDSKVMNELLAKSRTQHFDIELIDKIGGAKKMLAALKNGRALGILPDQDASDSESVVVEFFGKKVNWNAGASVIAKKVGALLIPAFVYQRGEKYAVRCFAPLDAALATKEELSAYQAKCCEEMIRARPDEYFFFHKRFKRFYDEIYA